MSEALPPSCMGAPPSMRTTSMHPSMHPSLTHTHTSPPSSSFLPQGRWANAHPTRPMQPRLAPPAAMRESKDPSEFASMDELRDYLHTREGRSKWSLTALLNFLGEVSP